MAFTILLDLDSICIDLHTAWLGWYNSTHQDNATVEDLVIYDIEKCVKYPKRIYEFFKGNRYRDVPVMPGAQDCLHELHEAGHDLVIATATAGKTANTKWELVGKYFPFIPERNVMVGKRKDLLWGDMLIDDAPHNLKASKKRWPEMKLLTIAHPYNAECKDLVDCYAEGWKTPAAAWRTMGDYIKSLQESAS